MLVCCLTVGINDPRVTISVQLFQAPSKKLSSYGVFRFAREPPLVLTTPLPLPITLALLGPVPVSALVSPVPPMPAFFGPVPSAKPVFVLLVPVAPALPLAPVLPAEPVVADVALALRVVVLVLPPPHPLQQAAVADKRSIDRARRIKSLLNVEQ